MSDSPLINRRDLDFLLYEFLDVQALCERPRFATHDRETFDAAIETAHSIALEKFLPHAAKSDEQEPTFDGERVHVIPEVGAALEAYCDSGLMAASFDEEVGGAQFPWTIAQACGAMFSSANVATYGYPFLTIGAANLIDAFGSPEQEALYLPPMLEGRFFGTMCLSEPQAGSSLADIRTRAEPAEEGHYLITGNKMWISGGEHELSENIIHMVLAKIPGGPPGVKGISLFIVPRSLVEEDGSVGERNDVALAGLNHKMGYRGTVNTLLNFGEQGRCVGYLVGEPHRGLGYMFHMMNEARVGVGLGATMLGYAGYLYSLDYARDRKQGRAVDSKDPGSPPVPIIRHADIRRLLLSQKASVEGALALILYCARLIDEQSTTTDESERDEIGLLLDILTPIAKSWPSEFCLEANKHAIQVLGGYGYTRDYPVERLYRDNRLNPIHEGTHGIQGLDLLGRKAVMRNGAAFKLLMARVGASIVEAGELPGCEEYAQALHSACERVSQTTATLGAATGRGEIAPSLANATVYLDMLGHLVIAWIWLRQATCASHGLANASESDRPFYEGKLHACRYFYRYELPKVHTQASLLEHLDQTCLEIPEEAF